LNIDYPTLLFFFPLIMPDRRLKGLQNVFSEVISLLHLDNQDYIQARNNNKRKKIEINTKAKIILNPSIKPKASVLLPLIDLLRNKKIKKDEVLIIDDNPYFLKIAKNLGFGISAMKP